MSSDHRPLHIFFFPFLAHGHIIPTVDMAKLFAAKGIKATIITTPINAPLISKAIGNNCLIVDLFHTWITDSTAKLGIPRIVFQGDGKEKGKKGNEVSGDEDELLLKWRDTKKENSVVYVCYGTMTNFPDSQLREIAIGLEASGHQFLWIVRRNKQEDDKEWFLEGFEKRMKGKGLIIKGWVLQVLILEHQAIGAFMMHCRWNLTLEAVIAGVPMVTTLVAVE
ncbi:hypothetical protein JHK85_003909 [Glycine max]|nr:hypothetical protein JHK85_003909 [Glycine max]KAG5079672.1 hypothetical protein JHK86_003737 [Glycine max]